MKQLCKQTPACPSGAVQSPHDLHADGLERLVHAIKELLEGIRVAFHLAVLAIVQTMAQVVPPQALQQRVDLTDEGYAPTVSVVGQVQGRFLGKPVADVLPT